MAAPTESGELVHAEINGLFLAFDAQSGTLREMLQDGVPLLQAEPGEASLLDMACPGQAYDPLRLGARQATGARVSVTPEGVRIAWERLGQSRALETGGPVSAEVRIRPAQDGVSSVWSCAIHNQSGASIPQVLFPDLAGLLPVAGAAQTELRTCGMVKKPFVELDLPEDEGRWYASRRNWLDMYSGAYDKSMAGRWVDLGGRDNGFSLFPKVWGWGPLNAGRTPETEHVLLHLSQTDKRLRMMCEHRATIAPGARWESPEYVMTPRRHGWAGGIGPFRSWLREQRQRPHAMPQRLRHTLGYRSVWMSQQYADADPAAPTVVWRFTDLPGMADEALEHGLNEMVLWLWQPWTMPGEPSPELGSPEEFQAALDACRARGVNVSLFISLMTVLGPLPAKYGWTGTEEFWAYHTDYVPMLRPYYARASKGSFAVQDHPAWQADVTGGLLGMVARGWTSITWDQDRYAPVEPNIETIFRTVRDAARQKDPESTFAGENLNNLDLDSRWLDYTWNWALFSEDLDWRALVNAYDAPRFNVNVGSSPKAVKRLFMDHLFLNVLPSKPEGINGSARIAEYPALSAALKTCARLHRQFLPFFEDGLPIGDCVLQRDCPDARVNAYVLPDRVLVLAMNTGDTARAVSLDCDLAPWLPSTSGKYAVTPHNERGEPGTVRVEASAAWTEQSGVLQADELALFELRPAP